MNALATNTSIFNQISLRIIKQQELIIGPIAWEEARKVPGLQVVDNQNGSVVVQGDAQDVLNRLVAQYSRLFGKVSTEVCREAVQDLLVELPANQIPESLQ